MLVSSSNTFYGKYRSSEDILVKYYGYSAPSTLMAKWSFTEPRVGPNIPDAQLSETFENNPRDDVGRS